MSPESAGTGAGVRATAARVAARVVRDGLALEDALAETELEGRDASLLRAIAFGTLRWHHRLEWQVAHLVTTARKRDHAELGALLRVGLFQLQGLRVPEHAAVSATVEAVKLLGHESAKGLVNAVLRRFLRERQQLDRRMKGDVEALFAHPRWLIDMLKQDWPQDWRRILEQNNVSPPMWLRTNARRGTRERYLAQLAAADIAAEPSDAADCAVLLGEPRPVDALPGFADGLVSVQDAAAQLAAGYLGVEAGNRVLDACAAPGGKTAHILESSPALAELWAVDRDPARLTKVERNLERLGLTAKVLAADATTPAEWWDGQAFDRVLLDAPCSATGVIRRHPDIKLLRRPADVDRAVELQARLLDALWPLLERRGRLLYATCSVLRRENCDQVARFLARTPDAVLVGPAPSGRQILPGEADMDGFYYACLEKQDVLRSPRVSPLQHELPG